MAHNLPIVTRKPRPKAFGSPKQGADVEMADGTMRHVARLCETGNALNAKLSRNEGKGYRTIALSLAPYRLSGLGNLCDDASPLCISLCINISGIAHGGGPILDHILAARIARARLLLINPALFVAMLDRELTLSERQARKLGLKSIARLNVFSDVRWARDFPALITDHPDTLFYGYTKHPDHFSAWLDGEYPANYHLTFSRSEKNEEHCLAFLARGGNVTVVFDTVYGARHKHPLPATWRGYPVIDGDETDLRFLDPTGVIVGLRAKGKARSKGAKLGRFVVKTDRDPVNPVVIS